MAYVKKLGKAIAKFKNDKKLIEFVNKLRPAPLEEMATLHAGYDEDKAKRLEGRRSKKSVIGVTMLDYSNGTGDKTISVMANLSPYVIKYLYDVVKNFPQTFDWKESKIIGYIKDEKGQSPCTSITIRRNPKNS